MLGTVEARAARSRVEAADTGVPHEIRVGHLPTVIAELAKTTRWVASVCTPALLLGEAGLLQGRNATTNPAALGELSRYGATVRHNRVVDDGAVVTAAAVTAGIDRALWLVQRELGEQTAHAVAGAIAYPMPSDVWSPPARSVDGVP